MAKSYAQNLRAGYNQLHPPTPDLPDSALTATPLDESPIPNFAADVADTSPSAFAATHTLSNAAFSPITSIPGQSPQETRLTGLSAYVSQDLDPSASLTSNQIFGNTPQYTNDHNSNMAVGRAVASAHGYTGDPALFLREKGPALGYTFPSDLANEYQLYAHIGETFSQRERKSAQERIATQNARRPSQKEMEEYLPQALLKAATTGKLNWVEASLIKRAGIPESSIRKVRYILQSGKLPGITRGWRKELNSKFNDLEIDDLAKYVKDDPAARYILLELARKEGYDARSAMHDKDGIKRFGKAIIEGARNLREPFTHAVKEAGSGVATAVNNLLDGKTSLSIFDDNFVFAPTDEEEDRQRRAFRADFTNAFNTGYNQRTEELRNNLKGSFSFKMSDLLLSAGNIVGETLPYFNPTSAVVSLGGMASDEMNKAAANALRDDALNTASGWELYGAPATKATIFGTSIALTGGLAKGGISLVSRTAIGRAAASRIALSPALGYASRFAEGTATEALEELSNAIGQEAFELTGLVADRQKEAHLSQFAETMASPEFWGANIGMNLGLAAFGLKGSRSKAPYKAFQDLKNIGFSAKEARSIVKDITQSVQNGDSPADARNIVSDAIRVKLASAPNETQQKLIQASRELAAQKAIEDAAASGVRDFLIQEAGISDMQKLPNGKIKAKLIAHNEQGQFEAVEQEFTEQELNDYLLSDLDSAITQEIINTQALVRGEQLARAAEASKSSPFARIASLQDAPAEVLAQLKGKDTFDADTLSIFAAYAIDRINQGNTSDFGDTSAPLQNVANVATDLQERIRIAREKGELKPGVSAESTSFIIPGKTTADNILMLARGQASAQSLAHDWLEGFARARYDADPAYWQNVLDSVDRELLQNKVTSQSLFASPEGSRSDLDYIEAFSHLAQSSWLAHHDNLTINDTAHALADEMLEDLGSVQNGLAVAQELARYLDSEAAQKAIGEGIDPLRQILTKAGASLTDLLQEAEKQAPKTAADFILQHRQRIRQELDSLAQEADAIDSAPPLTSVEPNAELQNTPTGISAPDGSPITLQDAAKINGISPLDGTLTSPPPATYTTVTAPNGAGKGLNGGIAHRLRDGTIEGVASLSALSLHPSLSQINLANAQGITDTPIICYRTKDGMLHVIGGFARLAHDQALGLTKAHVKIYPATKKHDSKWAADRATQESIRAGIASTPATLKYLIKHKLTRTQAQKQNLIPSDINGKELPTSHAAWLLYYHVDPALVSQYINGKIPLKQALESLNSAIINPSSPLVKELSPIFQEDGSLHTQNAISSKPTASFSISPKKNRRRYTKLADMVKHEQFLALLDEAKRIERQSINFIDPEQDLDSTLTNSAKLNGLLNAIYSILPKDARPWKVLPYLEKRFNAFAHLSVNPHLPANPNADYASAFTADEITRYNELLPQERRTYIAQKLARAYKELAVATARSLEAYLSRSLFEQVERTIKTLQPKQQPSGKEKRSITSATTFRKAMQFYDMMAWSPAQVTTRQNELLAAITQENASEEQRDTNQRELNALSLFGALRSADLDQTQKAVAYFMEFVELGKEQWRDHLADERENARKVRLAVAKLKPSVRSSAVDKKAKSATAIAGGMLDSFMNPAQTLSTLAGLQGEAGTYFSKTLTDLCTSLDNCYLSIDSYKKKADALLDQELGIAHLPSIVRDAKRAAFLVDANQYKHPGIFREGTHPVHNYQFTKRDVEHLLELKKAGDADALKTAINNCLTGSNVELPLQKRPALRALADAISQYKDKNYQGGTIFVQTYDKRDSSHIEELDITPLQAANIVLMAEQPSYANKYDDDGKLIEQGTMDLNGYTDSVLGALEHYAGPKLMNWLRQCRQLFDTTGLFEAYEEQVGLPFPREANYWPGIFETPKQGTMTDALDAASKGVGLHQMLIKRRDHISPPNITISATDAWERAISQHFFYIHLSPITRELRRVFRNSDFQTRLKDLTSPQAVDNLIQLFDTIDGAPNLCLRASQPFNKAYAAITGKQALNVLAGMTSSAVKNLTGYLNGTAYQGINAFNLIPYTLKGVSGLGHATPATIAKLPVFRNRLHRDSLTGDANRLNPGQKQTALHAFGLYGMRAFMEYPDYGANLLSMTAVYNCHYDTMLAALKQERGKHYTPTPEDIAQIKKSCEEVVSVTMHRAAQPMEKTDKSAFLQTQNWAQNMTTYMKGEMLIKIGLARESYLTRRNKQLSSGQHKNPLQKNIDRFHAAWDYYKTLATFSLAGQGVAALLTILTGGAPDDEDEFQNWLLANTVAGLCGVGFLSLVPIVGDSLSAAGQFVFGERGAFATYSTAGIGGLTKRNISNAYKLVTSDPDELNTGEKIVAYGDLSRFLGTLISAIGIKSTSLTATGELITGCSVLLNAVRPYGQYLKNTEKKATRARRELEQYQRHQRALLRKLLKSSSGTAL